MRILIVDDEAGIRKTTRIAIETAGHEAAEAPNGARALKAIEEEPFDVVFLDLKLGLEDGLEVLARLLKADRKSTRLNSSHSQISYAVFCLKKKKTTAVVHHVLDLR